MVEEEQQKRRIVIPSHFLGDASKYNAGRDTFEENGKIYASRLGFLSQHADYLNVIPLTGVYDPIPGDMVIGVVEDASQSIWLVDINAPYPAVLHVNEVPWRVDFGETTKYLNYGDTVLAKILTVDETKKIQITLNDRNLHKLSGGQLIEIEPIKVPRVIGKKGSMISMLKRYTNCRIFIGQNGRIWIDGKTDAVARVTLVIRKIEAEAHIKGLTDRVTKLLKEESLVL